MKSLPNVQKAKIALWGIFAGPKDGKGYTQQLQDNLVQGVRLDQFKDDLLHGDGNELETKFRAIHSSSALAVNCFTWFKDFPPELLLLGKNGAVKVQFEKNN